MACVECGKPLDDTEMFCDECTTKALSNPDFWQFYIGCAFGVSISLEQAQDLINTGSCKMEVSQ